MIRWIPPGYGWHKVNTDGAINKASGNASTGGLIRDQHGMWIVGFLRNIGYYSVLDEELWGALESKSTLKQDRRNELEWGGNWVRLQTDGAMKIDSSYATTGGVLKDENGEWLLGFNRCLGTLTRQGNWASSGAESRRWDVHGGQQNGGGRASRVRRH
ncbi:uncharacterized protein [Gossypium hirsutum]|uniref:RNase H type-1 domain-containing protein n=1 Tax=Gossypium hirsutum TaxID=3635 RepID=A0A1U8MTJ1_GOSHI|nr:uncharacterized protein LOC107941144 [Gossypium hirsutum]